MNTRINEIKIQIKSIAEELKGPMSNLERELLVADRRDLRKELEQLEADELSVEMRGVEAK